MTKVAPRSRSATAALVPAVCFVLGVFLMPETRKNGIWQEGMAPAHR